MDATKIWFALAVAAAEGGAEVALGTVLRGFRGVGRRCVEMSKSSLKLDMQTSLFQRDHLFADAAPTRAPLAAVPAQRLSQRRVPGVVQTNELGFAVAAVAKALHVEPGAGVVKVKLRPLATVRAGDDVKVAGVLKVGAQGTVAQARGGDAAAARGFAARGAT